MSGPTLLAWVSGLALVRSGLDVPAVLGTSITLQICHAILCRIFAHNNGYPKNLWTLFGALGGVWAVAALILLPRRNGAR